MSKLEMLVAASLFAIALSGAFIVAQSAQGQIVDGQITSTNFANNKMVSAQCATRLRADIR